MMQFLSDLGHDPVDLINLAEPHVAAAAVFDERQQPRPGLDQRLGFPATGAAHADPVDDDAGSARMTLHVVHRCLTERVAAVSDHKHYPTPLGAFEGLDALLDAVPQPGAHTDAQVEALAQELDQRVTVAGQWRPHPHLLTETADARAITRHQPHDELLGRRQHGVVPRQHAATQVEHDGRRDRHKLIRELRDGDRLAVVGQRESLFGQIENELPVAVRDTRIDGHDPDAGPKRRWCLLVGAQRHDDDEQRDE